MVVAIIGKTFLENCATKVPRNTPDTRAKILEIPLLGWCQSLSSFCISIQAPFRICVKKDFLRG